MASEREKESEEKDKLVAHLRFAKRPRRTQDWKQRGGGGCVVWRSPALGKQVHNLMRCLQEINGVDKTLSTESNRLSHGHMPSALTVITVDCSLLLYC